MSEEDYIAGNPRLQGSERLVVVSGCSGGGKSSLLKEMAARGYAVQPEAGRQIVKEQVSIGGDGLPWENPIKFVDLCVSRCMYFYNTAVPLNKPVLFDRSMLDNIAGFQALGLPTPPYFEEALKRYRYARRVFMIPPWKELFVGDAERRHSFDIAEAEYERLLRFYPAHGYELVIIPKGTIAERANFLERELEF